MSDLEQIPNRDEVVGDDRRITRPWLRWLTLLRAAVNRLIAGIFDGDVTVAGNLVVTGLLTLSASAFPVQTWTVTIGGTGGESGQVYAFQNAYLIKIGPFVAFWFRVQLSTLGTITGVVQIKGLPFASVNQTGFRTNMPIAWGNLTTAVVTVIGTLNENTTAVTLFRTAAATTSINTQFFAQADLTNTTLFTGSGFYITST